MSGRAARGIIILSIALQLCAITANGNEGAGDKFITVAVLGFTDRGPSVQLAPLREALAEMLVCDLSQYSGLRSVERIRVQELLGEKFLSASGAVDKTTAAKAARELAADYLVSGTFAGEQDRIVIETQLLKIGNPEPIMAWKLSGVVKQLFDLEAELAKKILDALPIQAIEQPRPEPKPEQIVCAAVMQFTNHSATARLDPMEDGFADILQATLSGLPNVQLVERSRLNAVLKEQKLSLALSKPQDAIAVGKLFGAKRLLCGSFVEVDDRLRLDVRLIDCETAAVIRFESVTQSRDRFGELIESLALRLAADLALSSPADAEPRVHSAVPSRSLEAAVHYAAAQSALRDAKYREATLHCRRLLLLEPGNLEAQLLEIQSLFAQRRSDEVMQAAERALAGSMGRASQRQRTNLTLYVADANFSKGNTQRGTQVLREALEQSTGFDAFFLRHRLANKLFEMRRVDEAVAMMEQAVGDESASLADGYGAALRDLLRMRRSYLAISTVDNNIPEDKFKEQAAKAGELLDLIFREAEGKRDEYWRIWAATLLPDAIELNWKKGNKLGWMSMPQKERTLRRFLEVFSWVNDAIWVGHLELARICQIREKWSDAISSYRYAIDHPQNAPKGSAPSHGDIRPVLPTDSFSRLVEAQYQIAQIQREHLGSAEEALATLQGIVQQYGLCHHRGIETLQHLHRAGAHPHAVERGVLIVGGGFDAWMSWNSILKPLGHTVHAALARHVSAATLAPYDLVVLVRQGAIAWEPTDILSFRSYVAMGGSLFIVVSPGWEPAAPSVLNPLLSFFGVGAVGEMLLRAESTSISPHPITEGEKKVMAKNAVALEVPPEASLVRAGDHTLLAAMPYRGGRVAVASLGQWYLPGTVVLGEWWKRKVGDHATSSVAPRDLPIGAYNELYLPLLKKVIHWLGERPEPRFDVRDAYRHFQADALLVQFGLEPADLLTATTKDLLAMSGGDLFREEALWAAAETSYQPVFTRDDCPGLVDDRIANRSVPDPQEYLPLIQDFPSSDLWLLARWRRADAELLRARRNGKAAVLAPTQHDRIAKLFEDIGASRGTLVWAWTQLRLGEMNVRQEKLEAASAHFRDAADTVAKGPEKLMAIAGLASCQWQLKNLDEAKRSYRLLTEAEDVYWILDDVKICDSHDWRPVDGRGYWSTNSRRLGFARLKSIAEKGSE